MDDHKNDRFHSARAFQFYKQFETETEGIKEKVVIHEVA